MLPYWLLVYPVLCWGGGDSGPTCWICNSEISIYSFFYLLSKWHLAFFLSQKSYFKILKKKSLWEDGIIYSCNTQLFFLDSMCNRRKVTASEWELIKSYTVCEAEISYSKPKLFFINQPPCKPGEVCLPWHCGMSVCRREGAWSHTVFLAKCVWPLNSPCFYYISHLRIFQYFNKLFELFFRLHRSLRLHILQLYIWLGQLICAWKWIKFWRDPLSAKKSKESSIT